MRYFFRVLVAAVMLLFVGTSAVFGQIDESSCSTRNFTCTEKNGVNVSCVKNMIAPQRGAGNGGGSLIGAKNCSLRCPLKKDEFAGTFEISDGTVAFRNAWCRIVLCPPNSRATHVRKDETGQWLCLINKSTGETVNAVGLTKEKRVIVCT